MRSAERKNVNVLKMKCFFDGIERIDGIERE